MEIKTISSWDEELWQDACPLYTEAFGDKGAKPVKVIKNMFAQGIAELHVGYINVIPVVMALTGKLVEERVVIIDYLAVAKKERGQGLGKRFVEYFERKAFSEGYQKIIIEAEAEETSENKQRIHFWQACGFLLTEYVHHYIWVPEIYHAMYLPLSTETKTESGEELFGYITTFHRRSFQGKSKS